MRACCPREVAMGKNRRSVFSVTDTRTGEEVMVDSKEEVLVYKWLLHAM